MQFKIPERDKGTGWADLLDRLCAIKPLEVRQLETKLGPGEAVACQVFIIGDDGSLEDLGVVLAWGEVLRQDLGAALGQWHACIPVRPGRAYLLDPPGEDDTPALEKAWAKLTADEGVAVGAVDEAF